MKSTFSSEFFKGNRRRLRELVSGEGPIVVSANGLLQRGGDSTYNFAQDANFWYLTGIDEPDLILVMERDKEYLIVPGRSASREAFDGAVNDQALTKRSGIKTIFDDNTGWEQLTNGLLSTKQVATLTPPPAYIEHYGIYTNPARAALIEKIKNINGDLEPLELNQHLTHMRMIKQPEELAAIQAAIDITIASLKDALPPVKLSDYTHEYQLEAQVAQGFRSRGADGHAFEPIVAGGKRACTLHNVANNGPLAPGELVIVDVGAEVEHYAADITRTISLGDPTARQRQVHEAVLEVQKYAFSLLRPGVILKDYEQQIEQRIGEALSKLGVIKDITHDNIRAYYPHSTSHFLGLNVHDIGDYERPLEPGIVMTVEPGLYIPQEGIGVRIEDDVLITPTGIKILSQKLSRDLG